MKAYSFHRRLRHFVNLRCAAIVFVVLAWTRTAFSDEIHDAIKSGDLEKVQTLLKDNPNLVFKRDSKTGYTLLQDAAIAGNTDEVELLLAKGTKIEAKDNKGDTPLQSAVFWGHKDVAQLLLAKGADVNTRDKDGFTPLDWAALWEVQDIAELLIANKADISVRDKKGRTPLHMAVCSKGLVGQLLQAATVSIIATNEDGKTTSVDVAQLLLANKGDINAKEKTMGDMPLKVAANNDNYGVAELLLASNAEVNAGNNYGTTALHDAAYFGHKDVVALLLAHGAEIDIRNKSKQTPLHGAALEGQKVVVEFLLAKGADVNARDNHGFTPMYYAVNQDHKDVEELLRQHGGVYSAH